MITKQYNRAKERQENFLLVNEKFKAQLFHFKSSLLSEEFSLKEQKRLNQLEGNIGKAEMVILRQIKEMAKLNQILLLINKKSKK